MLIGETAFVTTQVCPLVLNAQWQNRGNLERLPVDNSASTHARRPDVDAIQAAEERGLPDDNIIAARNGLNLPGAVANRGSFRMHSPPEVRASRGG